ncbi:hypothetical protein OY671_007808, partial [Metschnikowia pulcherrima]
MPDANSIRAPPTRGKDTMARFDNFADFASHYADSTSAAAFPAAFRAEIGTAELSIHEEPTTADMPDEDA